jgi:hypothetical protein
VLPENRFRHGALQVARVNLGRHDGGDRALDPLPQLPALTFQRERRDDLVPVADLAYRPRTARDLFLRDADETLPPGSPASSGLPRARRSTRQHCRP